MADRQLNAARLGDTARWAGATIYDDAAEAPYALYYGAKLIGYICDPAPHGDIGSICECLSPNEGAASAVPVRGSQEGWAKFVEEHDIRETIGLDD